MANARIPQGPTVNFTEPSLDGGPPKSPPPKTPVKSPSKPVQTPPTQPSARILQENEETKAAILNDILSNTESAATLAALAEVANDSLTVLAEDPKLSLANQAVSATARAAVDAATNLDSAVQDAEDDLDLRGEVDNDEEGSLEGLREAAQKRTQKAAELARQSNIATLRAKEAKVAPATLQTLQTNAKIIEQKASELPPPPPVSVSPLFPKSPPRPLVVLRNDNAVTTPLVIQNMIQLAEFVAETIFLGADFSDEEQAVFNNLDATIQEMKDAQDNVSRDAEQDKRISEDTLGRANDLRQWTRDIIKLGIYNVSQSTANQLRDAFRQMQHQRTVLEQIAQESRRIAFRLQARKDDLEYKERQRASLLLNPLAPRLPPPPAVADPTLETRLGVLKERSERLRIVEEELNVEKARNAEAHKRIQALENRPERKTDGGRERKHDESFADAVRAVFPEDDEPEDIEETTEPFELANELFYELVKSFVPTTSKISKPTALLLQRIIEDKSVTLLKLAGNIASCSGSREVKTLQPRHVEVARDTLNKQGNTC